MRPAGGSSRQVALASFGSPICLKSSWDKPSEVRSQDLAQIHAPSQARTPASVFAAANDPNANIKRGQVCEANFYSGELALQQGMKLEATRLFQRAAADCPEDFVEWPAANAKFKALEESP
jgi:hypothetical protein